MMASLFSTGEFSSSRECSIISGGHVKAQYDLSAMDCQANDLCHLIRA